MKDEFILRKTLFTKDMALYCIEKRDAVPDSPERSFEAMKAYLINTPAYHDPHARIIIEENSIYFGHGPQEIAASFPELCRMILVNNATFTEKNIIDYGYGVRDACVLVVDPISQRQDSIKIEARDYFRSLITKETQSITYDDLSPDDTLLSLIDSNEVVAIGEVHQDKSSKKLLIDNMPKLSDRGVVIYLEHLFYDTQKEVLDAYFESESLEMPIMLRDYLASLDKGFKLEEKSQFCPYTFTGLVVQAKRYGVRIVPIDTVASYSTIRRYIREDPKPDENDRSLMMNYLAARHYDLEARSGEKALFFVGSVHINAVNSGVPGIGEEFGCPTLVVQDIDGRRPQTIAAEHPAKPDVIFYMKPSLSDEARQFQSEYEQISDFKRRINLSSIPEIQSLRRAITKMDAYETTHNSNMQFLPVQLQAQLTDFITQSEKVEFSIALYQAFFQQCHKMLAENNEQIARHRALYKVALANIAVSCTVVGAPLVIRKMQSTHQTTGHAMGFFAKPKERQLFDKVGKRLMELEQIFEDERYLEYNKPRHQWP